MELVGRQLAAIPAGVWHTRLVSLDLSGNRLTAWPLPAVGSGGPSPVPGLRSLNLSDNRDISELPSGCFACCSATLRELDLSGDAFPLHACSIGLLLLSACNQ